MFCVSYVCVFIKQKHFLCFDTNCLVLKRSKLSMSLLSLDVCWQRSKSISICHKNPARIYVPLKGKFWILQHFEPASFAYSGDMTTWLKYDVKKRLRIVVTRQADRSMMWKKRFKYRNVVVSKKQCQTYGFAVFSKQRSMESSKYMFSQTAVALSLDNGGE